MSNRIDPTTTTVQVEQTRTRQADVPATPFKDVLAGGANALLTGAEVAAGALGGPVAAAAVRQARSSMDGGPGGGGGLSTPGAEAVVNAGGQSAEMAAMHAMNRESQHFNMQMLALQEEVQQENRRFTTLSNVVRASHDTAKAAVGNIRS
jgi:hypothetical protein